MPHSVEAITVWIDRNTNDVPFSPFRIRELIGGVCHQFRIRRAQVDLAITDHRGIRQVNRRFFASSKVTDVISFDLTDSSDRSRCFSIVVNAELARRQARLRGHSARAELALYIVHGMLHQLGFDDQTADGAERMHRREDCLLQRAGFGVVYHHPSFLSRRLRSACSASRRSAR